MLRALPGLALSLLLGGCVVELTGAACERNEHCPTGQLCQDRVCILEGARRCCRPSVDTRCASDGTVVTCEDHKDGCPSFPEGGGKTCDAPEVCAEVDAVASCRCPIPGMTAGSGCETPGQVVCSHEAVLRCVQRKSCRAWELVDDCGAAGAACITPGGQPTCTCPSNEETTLWVDPVRGAAPDATQAPTGAAFPRSCRFAKMTDALQQVEPGQTIVLAGFDRKGWRAATWYQAGDMVIPSTRNGHLYQATASGVSGPHEPAWPTTSDASVGDGAVSWRRVGTDAVAFDAEPFPLVIPAGVQVMAEGCGPDDLGCDPGRYTLLFGSAQGGAQAMATLVLGSGAGVAGFSVINVGGNGQAAAVHCGLGQARVDRMNLLGGSGPLSPQQHGILTDGSCELTASRTNIGGYQRGLVSDSTGHSTLWQVALGALGSQEAPNEVGLVLRRGTLDATGVRVSHSRQQGVIAEAGTELTLRGCRIERSGSAGLRVVDGTVALASEVGGDRNVVSQNGQTTSAGEKQRAGIYLTRGTLTGTALDAFANGTAGIFAELGGQVALTSARLSHNGGIGLVVRGPITVSLGAESILEANGLDNVELDGPAEVTLTGVRVLAAGRHGICINGGSLQAHNSTITGSEFTGVGCGDDVLDKRIVLVDNDIAQNKLAGIEVLSGTLSMAGNTVAHNGSATTHAGVRVATAVALELERNHMHSNAGAQLHVLGSGGIHWETPGTCQGSPTPGNRVSCYPAGAVGVRVSGLTTLRATGIRFHHSPPDAITSDFAGAIVTADGDCQHMPGTCSPLPQP
jgi:hypothetical protein